MKYSIFYKEKNFINKAYQIYKKIIYTKSSTGGPDVVLNNLIYGLNKLKVKFNVNPKFDNIYDNVIVLSDVNKLKKLINLKKYKNIKLIAGPNLVILPEDYGGILKNKLIDKIIVPSSWVKKLYTEKNKPLEKKIIIWPSGIDLNFWKKHEFKYEFDFLVYIKSFKNKKLLNNCLNYAKKKFKIKKIFYGRYTHKNYLNLLNKSKNVIFFSESESQGIMYFEAWSTDTPTFIYNKRTKYLKNYKTYAEPCPYFSKNVNGLSFNSLKSFKKNIHKFNIKKFQTRRWVQNNHNYLKSSKKLISIFEKLN